MKKINKLNPVLLAVCGLTLAACNGGSNTNTTGTTFGSAAQALRSEDAGEKNISSVYLAAGAYGTLSYSYDNENWTLVGIPMVTYNSIAINDKGNDSTLVAVGEYGSVIYSIDDGMTWTGANSGTNDNFNAVVYGDGKYVAVGEKGKIGVGVSADNWTNVTADYSGSINGVAYAKTATGSVFVATTNSNQILYSKDAKDWNVVSFDQGIKFESVKYVNNQFFAGDADGKIWHSLDGKTWIAAEIEKSSSGEVGDVVSVAFGSKSYLAITSTGKLLKSDDGQLWRVAKTLSSTKLNNIYFNNNIFIVVGDHYVRSSGDGGVTWNEVVTTSYNMKDVILTDDSNHFVYIGQSGRILRTDNKLGKLQIISYNASSINSVAHNTSGNQIIAVGNNGLIMSSTNGQSWQVETSNSKDFLKKIITLNNQYIAFGGGGTVNSSADGIKWSPVITQANYQFVDAATNASNIIVAVGKDGDASTSKLPGAIYSTDGGKSWNTLNIANAKANLTAITYVAETKEFLVAASDGKLYKASSSDIKNWIELAPLGFVANGLSSNNGTYIAAGNAGQLVMSKDLKAWMQCSGDNVNNIQFFSVAPTDKADEFMATGTLGSLIKVNINKDGASCSKNSTVDSSIQIFDYGYVNKPDTLNVLSVIPKNGANDVPANSAIQIAFDDPLMINTVNEDSVTLINDDNGSKVEAKISVLDNNGAQNIISVIPASPLKGATKYKLEINNKIRNISGNSLLEPIDYSFVTEKPVTVKASLAYPAQGAKLDVDAHKVVVQFSEPMNKSSFYDWSVSIPNAKGQLLTSYDATANQLTVFYSGNNSANPFAPDSEYTLQINGVETLQGQAVDFNLSFSTGAAKVWSVVGELNKATTSTTGASFIDNDGKNVYAGFIGSGQFVEKKLNSSTESWDLVGSTNTDSTYTYFAKFLASSNGSQYFAFVDKDKKYVKLLSCSSGAGCKSLTSYAPGDSIGALDMAIDPITNLPVIAVAYGPGNNNSYTNPKNTVSVLHFDGKSLVADAALPKSDATKNSLNIALDKAGNTYVMEFTKEGSNIVAKMFSSLNGKVWNELNGLTLSGVSSLKGGALSSLTSLKIDNNNAPVIAIVTNANNMLLYRYNCSDIVGRTACTWGGLGGSSSSIIYNGTTDFTMLFNSENTLQLSNIQTLSGNLSGSILNPVEGTKLGNAYLATQVSYLDFTVLNGVTYAVYSDLGKGSGSAKTYGFYVVKY